MGIEGLDRDTAEFGRRDRARPQRAFRQEFLLLTAAAAIYFGVREAVEGSTMAATHNAERLRRFESRLGLDIEDRAQELVVAHGPLRTLGNFSYVWLHWPLIVALLGALFVYDRQRYLQLRRAMFVSGVIGLVVFALFPVSPPRFLADYIGTVSDSERRHYLPFPIEWANRYAAFPSFHVGWTLIACIAVKERLPLRWLRALVMLPAVLVAAAVITTGNHYVADAVVGATIALLAYAVVSSGPDAPLDYGATSAPTTSATR